MQSYYKNEIARAAGVGKTTFTKWMKETADELAHLHLNPHQQILPPAAVLILCNKYCISEQDLIAARKGQL